MRLRSTLACVALLLALSAAGASVASLQISAQAIAVPAGGNLQQAIDAARPGDTITLDPGATYVGNFVLPVKQGNQFITIRTSAASGQPAAGERVTPDHAPQLAKIRSPNGSAALRTAAGAHHWRLELLEFQANNRGTNDIILLGDGSTAQTDLQQVPFELVVDRCFIHGDPDAGQKRGIA